MTFEAFEQFHEYCQTNAHLIFVRERVNEKWGSYSLKELGKDILLQHAKRFWDENRLPVMLREEMMKE